jgi:hypothetical protein
MVKLLSSDPILPTSTHTLRELVNRSNIIAPIAPCKDFALLQIITLSIRQQRVICKTRSSAFNVARKCLISCAYKLGSRAMGTAGDIN